MKKTMTIMSILLGIGAIAMFVLASVLNFSLGWTMMRGKVNSSFADAFANFGK